MQLDTSLFRIPFVMLLIPVALEVHALSLTKDTVYESTFPLPQDSWASWHDSVSLFNSGMDTAKIESILFLVPEGKTAHLEFGFKKPYKKTGYVDGLVVRSGQRHFIASDQDKRIPPGGRFSITGFRIQECIACPLLRGSANNNVADTVAMLLVFDTGPAGDTLVIIGDIDNASSTTIRKPLPRQDRLNTGGKTEGMRFFNILGRSQPATMKFPVK